MKIALAAAFTLALAAPAQARAPLTQARADREAQTFVQDQEVGGDDEDFGGDPVVTSADLDPCELVSSRRAECDGTFTYTDGTECDFYVTVRTTRRDHLTSEAEIGWCDGEDD